MSIRRAFLALGMFAVLVMGAVAFAGNSAQACCTDVSPPATDNEITISIPTIPVFAVGGPAIPIEIAITKVGTPFLAYNWDVLTSTVSVGSGGGAASFIQQTGNVTTIALPSIGAGPICAPGAGLVSLTNLAAAPFLQHYGNSAGCLSAVNQTSITGGVIATIQAQCLEPGGVLFSLGDQTEAALGIINPSETADGNGVIPTQVRPITVNPLGTPPFVGAVGALCVQAGDLAITKTVVNPTNVIGGTDTYTINASVAATRTFSGATAAQVQYPGALTLTDLTKVFPATSAGATVTVTGIGPLTGCVWVGTITAAGLPGNTLTVASWATGGPCPLSPQTFSGLPYKTSAIAVGAKVNISDTAPAGTVFTGLPPAGCSLNAAQLTCTGLSLNPGSNVIGTVGVQFNTCGIKNNTATIAGALFASGPFIGAPTFIDVNPANNSSTANVNVDCPVLTVVKVATTAAPIFTSTNVTYTITVSNDAGGSAASGVVVTDALGAGQTLVSATSGGSCVPANTFPCTIASIPGPGLVVIIVVVKMPAIPGQACDTATAASPDTATPNLAVSTPQVCVTLASPFPSLNGIAKDTGVDAQVIAGPLPAETQCDGIDNDADGVIDDGCLVLNSNTIGNVFLCKQNLGGLPATGVFTGAGQSACNQFKIAEVGMTPQDADTCNDQETEAVADAEQAANYVTHTGGGDAPCAGQPGTAPAPWQWVNIGNIPSAPPSDICLVVATDYMPGQTAVNCETGEGGINGTGELPEGLGALEFQVKFDDKLFQSPTFDCTTSPKNTPTALGSTGRTVMAQVSIITENWVMFGCVSKNPQNPVVITPGADLSAGAQILGTLTLNVQPDLFSRMRPAKDNGVSTNLLDENCEFADTLGQPMNQTLGTYGANYSPSGGLTNYCADSTLTIRMLEGDVNLDCQVDISDDQGIAFRYGQFFGQLNYNRFYDLEPNISPDFDIDIKDLQTVFGRNGSRCSNPIPAQPPMNPIPDP